MTRPALPAPTPAVAAALALQFESAAELQHQIDALRWIAQVRPRLASAGDVDVWAAADGVGVLLEVRAGRLQECVACPAPTPGSVRLLVRAGGEPADANDAAWLATAEANAALAARLAAAGARPLSPVAGRAMGPSCSP